MLKNFFDSLMLNIKQNLNKETIKNRNPEIYDFKESIIDFIIW